MHAVQPITLLLRRSLLILMLLQALFVYAPFFLTGAIDIPIAQLEAKQSFGNPYFQNPLSLIGLIVALIEPITSGVVLGLLIWAESDTYRFKSPYVSWRTWVLIGLYSAYFVIWKSPFGYAASIWILD